ncbi:ribosomal protein L5 [Bonamia ostreae]|uniref:Ribosomal protein L5 n=1 Tax=Bonamia ostreae TaxID=126728 RepID=A0ABV2AG28_9EUKA
MALPRENHKTSYMRRFVVKYKRRRQCKTNYRKRARLVAQYKNKYETNKYRLVVRKTNRDIICQITSSDLSGDKCLVSAYSHELKRYGVPCGLKNYPAAYCTGMLLAKRLYAKLKKEVESVAEVNGEFYLDDESGAFRAFLDTGLARCSTGANIFGVLKGAVDGGLNVPHNTRRFPGSTFEKNDDGVKQWEYEPEAHRDRIFGVHIAEYMRKLEGDDPEKYKKQFGLFIKVLNDIVEQNRGGRYRADVPEGARQNQSESLCSERQQRTGLFQSEQEQAQKIGGTT